MCKKRHNVLIVVVCNNFGRAKDKIIELSWNKFNEILYLVKGHIYLLVTYIYNYMLLQRTFLSKDIEGERC